MAQPGYQVTPLVIERLRKARLAIKNRKCSEETKKKLSLANKGNPKLKLPKLPFTEEHKVHISDGAKKRVAEGTHNLWKGGITEPNRAFRETREYKAWRKGVFERDNYTCVKCGDKKGGNLNADHIKPFSTHLELRLDISNGRTLCKKCHQETDTFGWKMKHKINKEKGLL